MILTIRVHTFYGNLKSKAISLKNVRLIYAIMLYSKMLVKNSLNSSFYVYQNMSMYNHSIDTILLGNFVSLTNQVRNILDIGTNNGILSIFVAHRKKNIYIDAIEIQERAIMVAKKNLKLNNFEEKITLIHDDFNNYVNELAKDTNRKYDLIMCNPPFLRANTSFSINCSNEFAIATQEIKINLEQIIEGASKIIRRQGFLTLVHMSERIVEIVTLMKKYGFNPKRIQIINPHKDQKRSPLVLIEGRMMLDEEKDT